MSQPDPFINMQNICYFNATLQCILAAIEKKTLIANPHEPINIATFRDMQLRAAKKNKQVFNCGEQQCAGELITFFLDAYEEEAHFVNKFFFETTDIITCGGCGNRKIILDRGNIFMIANIYDEEIDKISFIDLVSYNCDICSHTQATKKTIITNVATILIFQIKRLGEKNILRFPDTIMIDNKKFEACGFIHHIGTAAGGHYVANVKIQNKWWVADDSTIYVGKLPQENITISFYRITN